MRNIGFSINYTPTNGEELYITWRKGSYNVWNEPQYDKNSKILKLKKSGSSLWSGAIKIDGAAYPLLEYKYFIQRPDGEIFYEAGYKRHINVGEDFKNLKLHDQWCGNTAAAVALTAPFSRVFFPNHNSNNVFIEPSRLIIQTIATNIPNECTLCIVGDNAVIGGWNTAQSIRMLNNIGARWSVNIPSGELNKHAGEVWEYKFLLYNKQTGEYIWERGENRKMTIPSIEQMNTAMIEVPSPDFGLPAPKFAGTAVPVFSLRSKSSFGVGDFKDLRLMIDWASETGQSIIQLLPINDTTAHLSWKDSYPYNCISTLALHPLYINVDELGKMEDEQLLEQLKSEQEYLNSLQFLDYTRTWEAKMRYCRAMYNQSKESTLALIKKSELGKWGKQNSEWLYPYAVFCTLRDYFKTADFTKWGRIELYKKSKATGKPSGKPYAEFEASLFSQEFINAIADKENTFTDDVYFYIYLQYEMHKQMLKTKEHAEAKGVALKGDIPIGIARCSVEAWQYPHLFNFNQAAGAPPDFFSRTGQNWGFPTYNWDEMSKDNYAWWKQRLTIFAQYFDTYRIDHILGFFRIWEVPIEFTDGRLGHFYPALPFTPQQIREMGVPFDEKYYCKAGKPGSKSKGYTPTPDDLFIEDPYKAGLYHPMISAKDGAKYRELGGVEKEAFNRLYDYFFFTRHNDMWYKNAMRKLQHLIAATNMLACGEDLGMLADSVIECMKNLKILSLELMIMPKQFGVGLGNPATYPYLSVCTTSTHDSETMRMWLGQRNGTIIDTVKDALPGDCIEVLKQNLAAPSMLAIFPLQDWISIDSQLRGSNPADERINDPSNSNHYWRYRMHITLEELLGATWMNTTIKAIIQESNRKSL